jgi:HUS1 checkpoint protein
MNCMLSPSEIFLGLIQAVEKLQKKCIMKFTETEMHVICNDDANEGGIQVWS